MIEDTSSRPLREWFEASPEPDIEELPGLFSTWARGTGKSQAMRDLLAAQQAVSWQFTPAPRPEPPKVGDIWKDKDGNPAGIVESVDLTTGQVSVVTTANVQPFVQGLQKIHNSIGTHIHAVMDGITASMKVFEKGVKSDYALFPGTPEPPKEETPRERALRLKQQPHSMTGKDGKFDSHGRCRY